MGQNKLVFIFVCFLLTTTLNYGLSSGNNGIKKGTIKAHNGSVYINPDGKITDSEWVDSEPTIITLYHFYNQTQTIDISLTVEHFTITNAKCNPPNLHFLVEIPDDAITDTDFFMIIFRTKTDEPFVCNYTKIWDYGMDNDIKIFDIGRNTTRDCYFTGAATSDTQAAGGRNDTSGHCSYDGNFVTFELSTFLDTTDSKDFSLEIGESIDIIFYYFDGEDVGIYSSVKTTDFEYDYYTLSIIDNTLNIGKPIFVIICCAVLIIQPIFRYFRKRNL